MLILKLCSSFLLWYVAIVKYRSIGTTFTLGVLVSLVIGLAFQAGKQQTPQYVAELENKQVLLDSKLHLIELKIDVVTGHKESDELQSDLDQIMDILETSHEYTGKGIIARDRAMREASAAINDTIAEGSRDVLNAIDDLLSEIEMHLHSQHQASSSENTDVRD